MEELLLSRGGGGRGRKFFLEDLTPFNKEDNERKIVELHYLKV